MITSNPRADHGSTVAAQPLDAPRRQQAMSSEILVADDDEAVRKSLTRLLASHGYAATTATSGTEAVQKALRCKPLIVLMDIEMPMMNGFDAAQAIKTNTTLDEVQIIALSASSMPTSSFASVFARILQKPCPGAKVIAAIEAAVLQHCFRKISQ